MVVVKTITVAFQTKVNRSIFIAVRSGTFHTLNMACHFARSLHVSFFEHAAANVKSCQNEQSCGASVFGILPRSCVLSSDTSCFGLPTGLSEGLPL